MMNFKWIMGKRIGFADWNSVFFTKDKQSIIDKKYIACYNIFDMKLIKVSKRFIPIFKIASSSEHQILILDMHLGPGT